MATDADASALVVTLVELGRRLGMAVVAEGVESTDVLEALAQLGCHEAQGFLLHPPLSASAFAALLDRESLAAAH
jgi:EAL domain-containing protein (putative c-di-GMP-specific phosphodiesterase class I)